MLCCKECHDYIFNKNWLDDNDYIGMARECRIIYNRVCKESNNYFYLPLGFSLLLDQLIEFEDYCLNQV